MRWTTRLVALTFGLFMLAANIQPATAQQRDKNGSSQTKRTTREEHDRITNTTFTATADDQGNARVSVTLGDFALDKIIVSTGETTLHLSDGKDAVSIVMARGGYVVERDKKIARFDPQVGTQDDLDAVRAVLLGSHAVRTFRRIAVSLENRDESDDEGPLFLGALVDGAIVEMLDGDSGATERIGKRITRKQRASLQRVKLRPELFLDCVLLYETSVVDAWDLFTDCRSSAWANSRWYMWFFQENLCEMEWLLRSQQYMYQFITCFAYPF